MRSAQTLSILLVCLLGTAAFGADDAAALMKTIQSTDAADVDRANAFEKIGDIAGDDAVEPLVGFLGDPKWSHYARFALQKMPGDKVNAALIKSLDTLQGDLKLGLITTIGRRQDPVAIAPLAKLLADVDPNVAESAAVALGWIATPDAAAELTKAFGVEKDAKRKAGLGSALLLVGQRLAKKENTEEAVAAFDLVRKADVPKPQQVAATQHAIIARGAEGVDLMAEQLKSSDGDYMETGLAAARVLPGESATKSLIDLAGAESTPSRQVLLILAMKDRGDKAALPAVLGKLKSDSPAVQLAAIDAVGTLGDASSVPELLAVAQGETDDAAIDSLGALEGDDVDAALMKAAAAPTPSVAAIKALGKRRAKGAIDVLFKLSGSDSEEVAREAIVALGRTVAEDRFLDLVALLKAPKSDALKKAAQEAIHAAIIRSTDPDLCADTLGAMIPDATGADRAYLFEQLRTAGGKKALAWMRKFALGSDEALQDAATKTLGEWVSADAGPVLLEVAEGNGKYAIRALGGHIRLFRQFELLDEDRVAMAAGALRVAKRPRERNAAIEALTRFPCVGSFDLALAQLDKPGSKDVAAKAVLTIARTVLDLDPEKGKAGLKRLIEADVNKNLTASAKALLEE